MVHSQAEYIEQNRNTKQKQFQRAVSLLLKSHFALNKMLFFGIVFVLYFLKLSKKSDFFFKKKLYGPFLWIRFNCLKARANLRRQFNFYH